MIIFPPSGIALFEAKVKIYEASTIPSPFLGASSFAIENIFGRGDPIAQAPPAGWWEKEKVDLIANRDKQLAELNVYTYLGQTKFFICNNNVGPLVSKYDV